MLSVDLWKTVLLMCEQEEILLFLSRKAHVFTVAGPEFPRRGGGGRQRLSVGQKSINLLFCNISAEICMKMKENWTESVGRP